MITEPQSNQQFSPTRTHASACRKEDTNEQIKLCAANFKYLSLQPAALGRGRLHVYQSYLLPNSVIIVTRKSPSPCRQMKIKRCFSIALCRHDIDGKAVKWLQLEIVAPFLKKYFLEINIFMNLLHYSANFDLEKLSDNFVN